MSAEAPGGVDVNRQSALCAAKELVFDDPFAALSDDVEFHGPAPIGRLDGRAAVAHRVTEPLRTAFPVYSWEPQLFLGGRWEGELWVAAHGLLRGAMGSSLWRIPAAGPEASLRIGIFHRFARRDAALEVVEVRMLADLPALAAQAGHELFPPTRRPGRAPAPSAGNGLVPGEGDPDETAATLALVEAMLGGCNALEGSDLASMGMAAYWHDDMRWYGPHGVGATHGFDEFQEHAQGPSVASFPNRRGGHHRARFADGVTAAFTGWPSLRGTFSGAPFRGIEPTGRPIGQNIMDFYVRRGDKLHENWVLIDLIDFAAQCGVDLLARLPEG